LLTADWVNKSSRAAAEKPPVRQTARRARRRDSEGRIVGISII
jgi:hypothetical protein